GLTKKVLCVVSTQPNIGKTDRVLREAETTQRARQTKLRAIICALNVIDNTAGGLLNFYVFDCTNTLIRASTLLKRGTNLNHKRTHKNRSNQPINPSRILNNRSMPMLER